MASINEMALIGTGIGLGIVHVLTGPDHLSALATLSAVSDCGTSFFLGVRWGMGHSTGLLLVGSVLILRDYSKQTENDDGSDKNDDIDKVIDMPDALSHFFESLVGFFMLFLGMYGFRRAWRKRQAANFQPVSTLDEEEEPEMQVLEKDLSKANNKGISTAYQDDSHSALENLADMMVEEEYPAPPPSLEVESSSTINIHTFHHHQDCGDLFSFSRRFSAKTMAVVAGIIHGLAGPGGVLGVIPAVQLHDWKLATLYLGCFCVSSTLTMGCFATLYGLCSSSVAKRRTTNNLEFQIHCFSSGLSILVGITWLVLLSVGKLEDVFP